MSSRIKKEIMDLLREKFGTEKKPVTVQAIHQRINRQLEIWLSYGILAEKNIVTYAYARLNKIKIRSFLTLDEWTKVQQLISKIKEAESKYSLSQQSKSDIFIPPKKSPKSKTASSTSKKKKAFYLKIKDEVVPDSFYQRLIDDINKSYTFEIYSATLILTRKLLENIIIDILKFKYKMANLDLFYIRDQGRHQSFHILIKNFETKLADFKPFIPELDSKFIEKIEKFKQEGNASAHSIINNVQKKDLDKNKSDLKYVVDVLLKLHSYLK